MERIPIRARARWLSGLAWVASTLTPAVAAAGPVTWVGPGGGFWEVPENWNPGLPGAGDDALLGAFATESRVGTVGIRSFTGTGVLTVSGGSLLSVTNPSSTGGLTLASGALGGAGDVSIAGAMIVSGGDHRGTGTTTLHGATTIGPGGFRLDGGAPSST